MTPLRFMFLERFASGCSGLRRFPMLLGVAIMATVLANLDTAGFLPISSNFFVVATAAFLAGFAGHMWAESSGRSKIVLTSVVLASALIAAALVFWHERLFISRAAFLAGLMLTTLCVGHLRHGISASSYWFFTARLGVATLTGILGFLIFSLGLSAIVASLKYLLGIDFGRHIYAHIWVTGLWFFGPCFMLALVPIDYDQPFEGSASPRGLERAAMLLCNFALVPLFIIYTVILHFYAGKIALQGALPRGEIGWSVAVFSAIGVVCYLVGYPWYKNGPVIVRFMLRYWQWALPVPLALAMLALFERIDAYGITVGRYLLGLAIVWLLLLFLYLAIRRERANIRFLPASLGLLMFAVSMGPWGAVAVSARSQIHALTTLLQEYGVVKDGQFVHPLRAAGNIPAQVQDRLGSILYTLKDLGALPRLAPWFQGQADNPFALTGDGALIERLRSRLGLTVGPFPWSGSPATYFRSMTAGPVDIRGFSTLYGPFDVGEAGGVRATIVSPEVPHIRLVLNGKNNTLTVHKKDISLNFNLAPLLRAMNQHQQKFPRGPLLLNAAGPRVRATLIVTQLSAQGTANKLTVRSLRLWLAWHTSP